MKWAIISIVAFACLSPRLGQAEAVRVSFEWIELDCTKCPELAAGFQPKEGTIAIVERRDPICVELEKRAVRRVLVDHAEWIEPGTSAKHTTRVNETTFDLAFGINLTEQGGYQTTVNASLKQGAELDATIKPGT